VSDARRRAVRILATAAPWALLAGCGRPYVVLDPAGPVARSELHLMVLSTVIMAAVVALVFGLFTVVLLRFRDTPGRTAPYTPGFSERPSLEALWFALPVVLLTLIALPTVRQTFRLAKVPPAADPVVVDVTSLTWKWLFQYPGGHVATVNYAVIPTGEPVLFEITANSPLNAFWVPQLGGMEAAMPGRVLPLWLQAGRAGTYWGRSAQYSGEGFDAMGFQVHAVPPSQFAAWLLRVRRTARPMTGADFQGLLAFGTAQPETYSSYPAGTFPATTHGFTLQGGMYTEAPHGPPVPAA
jgi:cytochrome aa3-600 menaquinol oxidase subunit 2